METKVYFRMHLTPIALLQKKVQNVAFLGTIKNKTRT